MPEPDIPEIPAIDRFLCAMVTPIPWKALYRALVQSFNTFCHRT